MLYLGFQAHSDIMDPLRAGAGMLVSMLGARANGSHGLRYAAAACELFAKTRLTHERPSYGIKTIAVGDREVAVREEPVLKTPFGTLLRFRKNVERFEPRVLLVAPLSGHFATLLRGTVRTLLADHDVFITDWHNGRDVGVEHGAFGFDEYVEHVIRFLEAMGPGAHVVAVCQPCVQVLAAVAIMAKAKNPAQPRSMTLMAGPVDARVNPTEVNTLALERPIDWFESSLIASVPARYAGARRRVYPGFVQLAAFMSMNADRHIRSHIQLHEHLAAARSRTPPTGLALPKFDWRAMQRFGISENDLPPGSTVFFKPPTAWETYRWQIVTVIAVLLLQAVLIALLLLERQRRRSAEIKSRARMTELAHVNRFATAGEMAASIAHEINQPLGAILNNGETAKIILRSRAPDPEMIEIVDDIVRDNLRATEIIARLRSFMKRVPSETKNVDMNNIVAETVKFLSAEARSRDIVLGGKLNGTALRINGDPIQLQQVLSNLILKWV